MLKDILNQFVVGVQNQSLCTSEHGGIHACHTVHLHHILHSAAFLRKGNHRRDVLIFQFLYFDFQFVFSKSFAEECSQGIGLILQFVGGNFFLEVIGHICIDTLEMDIFLLFLIFIFLKINT